jgi:hypothetical protein
VDISVLHNPSGIGLSTGIFTSLRHDWVALMTAVRSHNPRVAELSALSASELPSLVSFMRSHPGLLGGEYSVHAPSKDLGPQGLLFVADLLLELPALTARIVVHPDVIGQSLPVLLRLGAALTLENMDSRKTQGASVASLEELFQDLPLSRFCLDVAHAWSIDPSLKLAHNLLDAFENRLAQVHLSGITKDGHHCPLTQSQLDTYRPVLARCLSVPWILESLLA